MFMPPIPVASTHYLFVILKYLSHVVSHYKTSRSQTPLPSHYLLPICSDPPSDNDSFVIVKKSPTFISKPWRASKVSLSLDSFTASLRIFIYLFLTPNLKESAILNQMLQLWYYFQIPDLLMMKTWTERISWIKHKWVIIIGRVYTFFDRTQTDLFWNSHIKWLKWGEREIAPSWTFHFFVIFVFPVIPRCGARVGHCWMWYGFVSQSQHCLCAEFLICS